MARPRRNPFYPLLGIVGFAFTITAACATVSVLRGIRQPSGERPSHPLERLMDRLGTSLLAGELVVLAIATVGAVGLDRVEAERMRAAREEARRADAAGGGDGQP